LKEQEQSVKNFGDNKMPRKKKDADAMRTRQSLDKEYELKEKMKREIKELMTLKNWTQEDLAIEMGVAVSTAWRWYEGKAIPIPPLRSILIRWLEEAREGKGISRRQAVKSA
jgi:ribosome-binding protein aMBF1 (putative translation factor)